MTTNTSFKTADVEIERQTLGLILNAANDQQQACLPTLEAALETYPGDLMSHRPFAAILTGIREMVSRGAAPTAFEIKQLADVDPATWAAIYSADAASDLVTNLQTLHTLAETRSLTSILASHLSDLKSGQDPLLVREHVGAALAEGGTGVVLERPTSDPEMGDVASYYQAVGNSEIPFVKTGFRLLDARLSGGFQAGDFVDLAMETNAGKTSMAAQIGLHQIVQGRGVTYCSGELKMTGGNAGQRVHRLKRRIVEIIARVSPRSLKEGEPVPAEVIARLQEAQRRLDDTGLFRIHDNNMDVDVLVSMLRRCARRGDSMMIIDNLDHVTIKGFTSWEARDEIARRLMAAAHQTGVVVLALSQVKLEATRRDGPVHEGGLSGYKGVIAHVDTMISVYRDKDEAVTEAQRGQWFTEGKVAIPKSRSGFGATDDPIIWDHKMAEWSNTRSHNGNITLPTRQPRTVN
ncbi:DnaB-like helicase C-terminal domain-containing protein [Deinococcus sp. MIMF12]|uniref:DnaB-like helicase C-terminal domain-containing protein n=1 Tax=Deinococcus rhizophilus TaxID=3049544 RepID=A0ABT7JLM4_9DEIO|nr:DnaB-like helicase C-terminal domain-containing protein [Deinococcus rhizophilus]MDL2344843.1 DnaB-like helicase C-terminal domain-containing protein [Deinococcus rhizophilus]